jgi:hypothetical protein
MSKYHRRHRAATKTNPHAYRVMKTPVLDPGELAETISAEDDDTFREGLQESAIASLRDISALLLERMRVVDRLGGVVPAEQYGSYAALAAMAELHLAKLSPEARELVLVAKSCLLNMARIAPASEVSAQDLDGSGARASA